MRMHTRWIAVALVALAGCGDASDEPIIMGRTDAAADTAPDSLPDAAQCADEDADGYTTCDGDCDDTAADVHPDAADWHQYPSAAGSYDYDCSGSAEPESTLALQCGGDAGSNCETCAYHDGFWSEGAPGCGKSGVWVVSCAASDADGGETDAGDAGGDCSCVVEIRAMRCR